MSSSDVMTYRGYEARVDQEPARRLSEARFLIAKQSNGSGMTLEKTASDERRCRVSILQRRHIVHGSVGHLRRR